MPSNAENTQLSASPVHGQPCAAFSRLLLQTNDRRTWPQPASVSSVLHSGSRVFDCHDLVGPLFQSFWIENLHHPRFGIHFLLMLLLLAYHPQRIRQAEVKVVNIVISAQSLPSYSMEQALVWWTSFAQRIFWLKQLYRIESVFNT